ncbi:MULTISPECIES: ABC transporter ATP-binding protein [unclassified Streptomyces]|uniref:ABC transporter ATP-binding protein n=1 Tax=unclassified Streptomyces TaxID=2593676 RepID=UPI0023671049|nr:MULTISPECIES: ABC transporter ATP-binding protein [unclassified Streptomyces]MDF3149121.1 ABC transporter ATP-binding protein [Streptomyces sp. T21Q-yed]WDF39833.1 ABC transporter ATP-binding protein [Streptomyces sp. T12]
MRYGEKEVLKGVDLTVRRGEVLALLGPNGAGKTTTIEIMEGFRRRTGGDVSILGEDPDGVDEDWRARVGIVLQSWRDHQRWRVGELLEHFASYYRAPRDPAELLRELGLAEHAGQVCQKLSGGQRRKLDVALGIVGNPELLFLDEPTTGFDPVARREFHEMVERLRDGGMTMVLTTHDLHEAERLADRIAVLIDGRIHANGTPAELADRARAEARVVWDQDGERQTQLTDDPSRLVWELHDKLQGPIPGLQVHRPTLEDIYVRMIREGEAA